jgi:N-acetylglucosaminyl-diphospho-decaprenol L-rhamnosyltransferase
MSAVGQWTQAQMKELSIIIVNWNSLPYLRQCLKSVYAETRGIDFEVIVVDNDTSDNAANQFREEFPAVMVIRTGENLGFARANNLGVRISSGKNILFLNPDTSIVGESIGIMLFHLERLADAGIVGCKLLNSDLTVQTSCIQRFPTILNQVVSIEWLRLRLPDLDLWGIKPLFSNEEKIVPVDVVSGACLMATRDAFEKVGCFSEEYFMYAEDMDLCYKVQQAGRTVYYVGGATVIHYGGGSSEDGRSSQLASVRQKQAMMQFCRKTRGWSYAALYRAAMGINAMCRLAAITLVRPFARGKRQFDGTLAKWTAVLKWAVGLQEYGEEGSR